MSRRQPSVIVDDVHVTYRTATDRLEEVPESKRRSARWQNMLGVPYKAEVNALRGVSFVVYEGEHVGIVGTNGSGKSTLLRTIAGVETPTKGEVRATSTPSLLGVNAALIPHLTGTKNIKIGLLALGYSQEESEALIPEVADLAGLGSAIHRPMNTYSSGMGARLRFAIAAKANPEILLIDEALGTGDAAFSARAEETINDMRKRASTIFLVSHAAQTIEEMCTRALWLYQGKVILDGTASEVALQYRKWAWAVSQGQTENAETYFKEAQEMSLTQTPQRGAWPAISSE